jgi:hypothetical protein
VQVRLERQAIFDRTDAPQLSFILSESALRRQIGGSAMMRNQPVHLAAVGDRPNVELQVLPFDAQTYQNGVVQLRHPALWRRRSL